MTMIKFGNKNEERTHLKRAFETDSTCSSSRGFREGKLGFLSLSKPERTANDFLLVLVCIDFVSYNGIREKGAYSSKVKCCSSSSFDEREDSALQYYYNHVLP